MNFSEVSDYNTLIFFCYYLLTGLILLLSGMTETVRQSSSSNWSLNPDHFGDLASSLNNYFTQAALSQSQSKGGSSGKEVAVAVLWQFMFSICSFHCCTWYLLSSMCSITLASLMWTQYQNLATRSATQKNTTVPAGNVVLRADHSKLLHAQVNEHIQAQTGSDLCQKISASLT